MHRTNETNLNSITDDIEYKDAFMRVQNKQLVSQILAQSSDSKGMEKKLMQIDPKFGEMLEYDKLTDEMKHGGKTTPLINKVCANCINEEKEGRRGMRNYQKNEPCQHPS